MEPVAVVGLGAMGSRIAIRLLDAGHSVIVWNRTPEKLASVCDRGAIAASSPRDAAARSRILITMLADPEALQAVSVGPNGIAAGVRAGSLVIEMSTVGPAAVRDMASLLGSTARLVDAPVLGSTTETESGALTIFAGGSSEAVDEAEPLLATLGSVVRVGPLGTGAAAKLVANAALMGTLTVFGETLALSDRLGLPRETAARVLSATPLAEQVARRLPLIEAGDYPRRFALSLARKDADIIVDCASAAAAETPVLKAVRRWLQAAEAEGRGDADYTALLATILRPSGAVCERYDGLIVDLDGVVWLGDDPIEGVAETIARLRARGVRVLFLTNDPQYSQVAVARRLNDIGITTSTEDVLTAAVAAAAYLAAQARFATARAFVVGSDVLHEELAAAGLRVVFEDEAETADLVLVGGHADFDFTELTAAVRAVDAGAELFATGRDPFVPTRNGREPGTGAIVAAIETGTGATATVIGKPEPHMFAMARRLLADCRHVAVVGDTLASDIVGAQQAGLDSILVLSGATSPTDAAQATARPDIILPSLAALG